MQAVIEIYNASLGAKSNEISGKAIAKRENQGDTGTFVYVKNFSLYKSHKARVVNDLIPHIYDTAQTIRAIGEDGTERREKINQPHPVTVDGVPVDILNDITAGAYDVVRLEIRPSYATKQEEAREGMTEFIQAFPPAAPLMGDLYAKAQNWPYKQEVSDRLFHAFNRAITVYEMRKANKGDELSVRPERC